MQGVDAAAGAIDAHQHFWRYDRANYGWIPEGSALAADHLPADLRPELDRAGIAGCIAVQARQSEDETHWLLELAEANPWIVGVVGWIDLRADTIAERLEALRHPRLIGFRHIVQDEPDPDFLLGDAFVRGIRAVLAADLTYDVLVYARQADRVPAFLDRAGEGRFVLDHGAKPDIAAGLWQPWADAIAEIARRPNIWCKISGLVTEADHANWSAGEIERYLDHLLACFGPERLIYGSDWPVCRLAAEYETVHGLARNFVMRACPAHADAIFGGNARRAYKLA